MLLLTAGSLQEPIVSFVILLAVILIAPILFERLRLPGLVGLLASGVVLGSNGSGLIQNDSETYEFAFRYRLGLPDGQVRKSISTSLRAREIA